MLERRSNLVFEFGFLWNCCMMYVNLMGVGCELVCAFSTIVVVAVGLFSMELLYDGYEPYGVGCVFT